MSSSTQTQMCTEHPGVMAIPEFPDFWVTSDGKIFGPRGEKTQSTLKSGHRYVSFYVGNRKNKKRYVHRLVAEAFIGDIPKGMHVCHEDGDPANNAVSNLRLDTPKGNAADKFRHGTQPTGPAHWHSKLTAEEEVYVRSRRGEFRGVQRELARQLGVCESVISRIIRS